MVDRTYRTSMAGNVQQPVEQPINSARSDLMAKLLLQQAMQSQGQYHAGDPPAVAFQPALNMLGAMLAGKKADRMEGEKANRLAQLLGQVTSPVKETIPGTPPEVLPEGISGPTRPGTPDTVTERPRTLDETIGLLGQSPEGQPLANEVLLHKLKQQIEDQFGQKTNNNRGEYFVPIQTAKGIFSFNSRTGELRDSGGNVIGSSSDPVLQGKIAGAKSHGKRVGEESADVGRSVEAISSITDAMNVLDKGIYSGFYGKAQLATAKAVPGYDKQKAANTEEFISHIGNTVIPRLKEFGGSDTVEEMKYLEKVQAGDISVEPRAIRNILNIAERKLREKQQRLKNQAGTVGLESKVNAAIPSGKKHSEKTTLSPEEKAELEQLRKELSR